jgi:hypothetical protein
VQSFSGFTEVSKEMKRFEMPRICFYFLSLLITGSFCVASESQTNEDKYFQELIAGKFRGFAVEYYCEGSFTKKGATEYAIGATRSETDGGAYFAYTADGQIIKLSDFRGGLDLQCLTPTRAKALNKSIEENDIVHGRIRADLKKDIICGFINNTTSQCWAYDEETKDFFEVGSWTT